MVSRLKQVKSLTESTKCLLEGHDGSHLETPVTVSEHKEHFGLKFNHYDLRCIIREKTEVAWKALKLIANKVVR